MASSDDRDRPRDLHDLPIRFPKRTTFTFEPRQYRRTVDALRQFGVYEQALEALERNGVTIVLRSDNPDGVARALAAIQEALVGSPLYDFARRFTHVGENYSQESPGETEGCPIGKFLVGEE